MDAIADVVRDNPLLLAFFLAAIMIPAFALLANLRLMARFMQQLNDKLDHNLRVTDEGLRVTDQTLVVANESLVVAKAIDHAVNNRPPGDSTISEDVTEMKTERKGRRGAKG